MNARKLLVGGAAVMAGVLLLATQGTAQIKKGKTRPLTTKQMMGALIKPYCTSLTETLKADGPADEKAWETAVTQAALLNESGHMLMEDGRCPDSVWADASKIMQDGSQALVTKLEAKDVAGAREAMAGMMKSCGACHKVFKK
jgi:cytochrome c556